MREIKKFNWGLPISVVIFLVWFLYFPDLTRNVGIPSGVLFLSAFLLTLTRWQTAMSQHRISSGVCWSFWLVFLCIAPAIQVSQMNFPLMMATPNASVTLALEVLSLSSFALFLGEYFMELFERHRSVSAPPIFLESNFQARLKEVQHQYMIAITIFAFIFSFYAIYKIGFGAFFATRVDFDKIIKSSFTDSTVAVITYGGPQSLVALCTIYWILRMREGRITVGNSLIVSLLLSISFVLTNPFSSSRFWFWSVIGSYAIAFLKNWKRFTSILVASIPFMLVVIFPVLDYFRDSTYTAARTHVGSLQRMATNGDYDSFQMISNIIYWSKVNGIQWGHQLSGLLLLLVPRKLWDSKPYPTGAFVGQQLGYPYTNLSSPLPVEGYIDFGILGALLYCLLWGIVVRKLDSVIIKREFGHLSKVALSICLLVAIHQMILLRGPLIGTAARLFPILLVGIGARLLLSRQRALSRKERSTSHFVVAS